jgi:hypothetical protein
VSWYLATWSDDGECCRFASIDAIVRYIMDYDLPIQDATFIVVKPNGEWRDCGLLVDAALEEERLALGYEADHEAYVSSFEKTGRI